MDVQTFMAQGHTRSFGLACGLRAEKLQ